MYNLDGRVAIVTGAGRGIGRAIALRLADEGCDVAVIDVDLNNATEVANAIRAKGRQALPLKMDVRKPEEIESMVQQVLDALGEITILINNAGVQRISPLLDMDEKDWDFMFNVNIKGMWLCSKAVGRQMVKQGKGGRIINAASRAGKLASTLIHIGCYTATKHAVIGFTKALGLELAPHNIIVNCYCPGVIETPMWDLIDNQTREIKGSGRPGEVVEKAVESIPLGRIGTGEDVAKVVAFLCSDEAGYETGQAINITGGTLMH